MAAEYVKNPLFRAEWGGGNNGGSGGQGSGVLVGTTYETSATTALKINGQRALKNSLWHRDDIAGNDEDRRLA